MTNPTKTFKDYAQTSVLEQRDLLNAHTFTIHEILTENIPTDGSGFVRINVTLSRKEGRKYICSVPTYIFTKLAKLSQGVSASFGCDRDPITGRYVYNLIVEEEDTK